MTNDAMARKFNQAKQEALQQSDIEFIQQNLSESSKEVVKIKKMLENEQMKRIETLLIKIEKQQEINIKRATENLQIYLQNYLDTRIVDATATSLKLHSEKMENIQRNNHYYLANVNEKLNFLFFGFAMTLCSLLLYLIYSYKLYKILSF